MATIFLALAAAIMAVRADSFSRTERIVWVVISLALCVVEIRAVLDDRNFHAAQESADRRAESEARQREEQAFFKEEREFERVLKGEETLFDETTGGNSYLYFDIAYIGGPLGTDIPPQQKKGMMLVGTVPHFIGEYPLHNVYLSVHGPLGLYNRIDYGTMFPNELGRPRESPTLPFWPDKPKQLFFLFISTSNGSYGQVVLVQKFGDQWLWATRFSKEGRKRPIRMWAQPGFPKKELKADWDKN